ncbi:MAG: SAM-dependent methyltransferase [Clostridiales bacterium]|nr:SAM-dependent methyltransferase [Clostridiales bacterium]
MNSQSLQKLHLFLTGLEARIKENKDYFKNIKVVYSSGLKEFTATLKLRDDRLQLNFNGSVENLEINWMSERIVKHAANYERALVTYEERGTTIVIEADNRNVKMSSKQGAADAAEDYHNETARIGNRNYYIKANQAGELLREIGIMSPEGKVKNDMIRKYNQIDHYIELIDDMLRDLASRHESITVLDCACGKSYLSFVLNYYIKEVLKKPCYFIGLDYSKTVIDASKRMAANLGYSNMEFKVTDVKGYRKTSDIHLVISLHACDTATDEAMALALNNGVEAMVMVPCCHREMLSQYDFKPFAQVLKYGILKARIADSLTDGMRGMFLEAMGFNVSVVEYISPLDSPKNLMIRAVKTGRYNTAAMEEYKKLRDLLGVSLSLEKLAIIDS